MEKKNLKMYEAPAVEVVEMETACVMLAGSSDEPEIGDITGDSDIR